MELIFTPCCAFIWGTEGPVTQILSPDLLVGAPGIFSDLLRFVQMLKREWSAKSNGKLPHLFILVKLQPRFLCLQWKTCLWAELQPWCLSLLWRTCLWAKLQPWCLSLQWRTCPWAEHWSWWWKINVKLRHYATVSAWKLILEQNILSWIGKWGMAKTLNCRRKNINSQNFENKKIERVQNLNSIGPLDFEILNV